MAKYNRDRTAYRKSDGIWFLMPKGKERAPFLINNLNYLLGSDRSIPDGAMDLLTPEDRDILLEALDQGCFREVWRVVSVNLIGRSKANAGKLLAKRGYL